MQFIIYLLLSFGAWTLFADSGSGTKEYKPPNTSSYNYTQQLEPSIYNGNRSYQDTVEEPENPYDEGTGHYAGYRWAEENDPSSCDGNSDSFIEGCQEYLDQQEAYEEIENEQN